MNPAFRLKSNVPVFESLSFESPMVLFTTFAGSLPFTKFWVFRLDAFGVSASRLCSSKFIALWYSGVEIASLART